MKNYMVHMKDECTYIIKAVDEEQAIDLACDWFSERKPTIDITETDEEADNEDAHNEYYE